MWLDKGTFDDVVVRAELPNTGLWAETTAKTRRRLPPHARRYVMPHGGTLPRRLGVRGADAAVRVERSRRTPLEPLADAMAGLFDVIAGSLTWTR